MELALSLTPKVIGYQEFNAQTHFIVELFERELCEFKFKKFKKIAVRLMADKPKVILLDNSDVLLIHVQRNVEEYFKLDNTNKGSYLLKILFDALSFLVKKDKKLFQQVKNAYQKCLAIDCLNKYYYGDMKFSPDAAFYGQILCIHEISRFNIYGQIFDNRGLLLKNSLIISCEPYWLRYSQELGSVTWEDGLVLYNLDKSERHEVNL